MRDIEISKSAVNRSKKIDSNIAEAFKEFKARKAAEEKMLQESKDKKVYDTLYNSYGAKKDREREKSKLLTESLDYDNKATIAGLTSVLTKIVKESLLLDPEEYKAINENYEKTISDTIKTFLEKADLNENIDNPNTAKLLEFVEANKPSKEFGKYLTEAQLYDEYGNKTYETVNNEMDELSGDVMDRVAQLIDTQRIESQNVNDNLNAITNMQESERPVLFRNDNRKSILEVLALNEATEMVANGNPYNSDLALANAITYITVLETLDATGLVTVGKEGYRRLLEASGEITTPIRKIAAKASPMALQETEKEVKSRYQMLQEKINDSKTAGFISFSEWKKAKSQFSINESAAPEVKYDYIDRHGNKMLKEDVEKALTNEGFDFEIDDFNTIVRARGYKRI